MAQYNQNAATQGVAGGGAMGWCGTGSSGADSDSSGRPGWCARACKCCGASAEGTCSTCSTTTEFLRSACCGMMKCSLLERIGGEQAVPTGNFACVIGRGQGLIRSGWVLVPLHLVLGFLSAHTALILFGVAIGPAFAIGSVILLLVVAYVPRCMDTGPTRADNVTKHTFGFGTGAALALVGFACGGWLFQHVRDDLSDVSSAGNVALYVASGLAWVLFGLVYICTNCLGGSCSGLDCKRCCKALCGGTGKARAIVAPQRDESEAGSDETPSDFGASVGVGDTDVRDALLPPLILKIRRP